MAERDDYYISFGSDASTFGDRLAKDLSGAAGLLSDTGPLGTDAGLWSYGYLFAQALTIGGGTGDVQRNIVAERVLGLPHDVDVTAGMTWAEASRATASA